MAPSHRLGSWMEKAGRWLVPWSPFSMVTLISKVLIKQVVCREALVRGMPWECVCQPSVLRLLQNLGRGRYPLRLLPFGILPQDRGQVCPCFWETCQVGQTQLS